MKGPEGLDATDRGILEILSLYEHLNLLELWFEIGEAGTLEPVSKEEVLSKLHSLMAKGFVERVTLGNGNIRWVFKKAE
jgi:DNA-binding Lrp family transcriptional regulator